MSRTVLITGVTGNQGGAVAQALQGSGFHLRGLTRKPESDRAAALAQLLVLVRVTQSADRNLVRLPRRVSFVEVEEANEDNRCLRNKRV